MKIFLVSSAEKECDPNVYGGLELIVWLLATSFVQYKSVEKVGVAACKGSYFPSSYGGKLKYIPTVEPNEDVYHSWIEREEQAYSIYEPYLDDYDLICDHSWFFFPAIYKLTRGKRKKICHTFHGMTPGWHTNPPIENPNYIAASRIQAMMIENQLQKPVTVIHHGIDTDLYKPGNNSERGYYLFLNRIMREKGTYLFLKLAKNNPSEKFIIAGEDVFVGDKDFVNFIKKESEKLPNVEYRGRVSIEEKIELLRNAKALLSLPIYPYIEIFGLFCSEAMACGTPVISIRNGGLIDQIVHRRTGFLVDSLKEMDRCIKKDIVTKIDPAVCREHVKRYFSKERMAQNYLKFLYAKRVD